MMAWWQRLQVREQWMLGVGAVVLVLLILVGWVILPLQNQLTDDRKHLQQQRTDLRFLQQVVPVIERDRSLGFQAGSATTNVRLSVQNALRATKMTQSAVVSMGKAQGHVTARFTRVSFARLLSLFDHLWKQAGVEVTSADIQRKQSHGVVDATVTLGAIR